MITLNLTTDEVELLQLVLVEMMPVLAERATSHANNEHYRAVYAERSTMAKPLWDKLHEARVAAA
jgi:hypothetical protein